MRIRKLIAMAGLLSLVCMQTGCAKTVTTLFEADEKPPKTISIDVTFAGTPDGAAGKYFIVFADAAGPQIPFDPEQFVEPGEVPQSPIHDYYQAFYLTWKNYVVIDGPAFFVPGAFTSEAVPTKEAIHFTTDSGLNKFTVTFDMSMEVSFGDRMYFDIVAVDKAFKIVKDNLSPGGNTASINYFYTKSGTLAQGTDESSGASFDPLDITSWRVYVQ